MTETEWLTAEDPDVLLKWLQKSKRHRPTLRKLGLFAVACAKRMVHLIEDDFTKKSMALVERLVEGEANRKELKAYQTEWMKAYRKEPYLHIAIWASRVMEPNAIWKVPETSARSTAGYVALLLGDAERVVQCAILRDVMGNPYRPLTNTDTQRFTRKGCASRTLAEVIYRNQEFDQLPHLAKVLEQDGCNNDDLLRHCRDERLHVRGCCAVDFLLDKK